MEDNKILVTEVTENVEQTTEETQPTVKTYTQEEVDVIVGQAKARTKAKIQKVNDRKYGNLIETLKAGTGKDSIEEINSTFTDFYKSKGIDIPNNTNYSKKDNEILAQADAEEVIRSGYDEVIEEVDRLTTIGYDNMTDREKAVFKILAEHRENTDRGNELAKIGVTEDVYNSKEFKDFASKFNSNTPIADIYDIYNKTLPKKEIKTMGSMKNTISADSGIKDYYSPEEARRFSQKEINENPELFAAISKSMLKWK